MSKDESAQDRIEKIWQVEDDRIFLGAAVLVAQIVGQSGDLDEARLVPVMDKAIKLAYTLHDKVQIRRGKIREDAR